jgi:RNase adaptor protein for sRNA GlmZ degradation
MKVKKFQVANQTILENSFYEPFTKISDKKIIVNRDLIIYTWSKLKNIPVDCDIIFDLSEIKIPEMKIPINDSTGLDERIQKIIKNHSSYINILKSILKCIELNEYKKIGFICDYGKIISVGFAELLKKDYYQNSIIHHNNLKVCE